MGEFKDLKEEVEALVDINYGNYRMNIVIFANSSNKALKVWQYYLRENRKIPRKSFVNPLQFVS